MSISMDRDQWQEYCRLENSGDYEALREYVKALEEEQRKGEEDDS